MSGITTLEIKGDTSLYITSDKAVFTFYAHGQKWEEPAKKCITCYGDGEVTAEKAVVDYVNGGFLDECIATCEDCDGYGWVPDHGQEEE
jgi:DnaJ-class molecular chaperone